MELNNKIGIYLLVYIILPVTFLLGCRKKEDTEILERDSTDALKGFLVLYVAIHHYVQKIINPGYLYPLNYIGFICVSFFFLMSGYGLALSFEKRGNLQGFFRKRILRLYFPFVISNVFVGILYNLTIDAGYSIADILISSVTMRTVYSGVILWYVFVQILMYIVFYISFGFFKNKDIRLAVIGILSFIYICLAVYTRQGEWRYNTVLCFLVGVIIATYKEQIKNTLARYGFIIRSILLMAFILSWYLVIKGIYGYYVTFICAIFFVLLAVSFSARFNSHTKMYGYIGKISYEMYILQLPVVNMVVDLLGGNMWGIFAIILITVILAVITSKISNLINFRVFLGNNRKH